MNTDFKPICVCFIKETDTGLKYNFNDLIVELEISNHDKKLATDFLYMCNGRLNINELSNKLNVEVARLAPLVDLLIDHNIIVDSRKLSRFYHDSGNIPEQYAYDFNKDNIQIFKNKSYDKIKNENGVTLNRPKPDFLTELLQKRESTRVFKNEALFFSKIEKILRSIYMDSERHFVPSAGSFYPLEFYVILNFDYDVFKAGLYKYNHHRGDLVHLPQEVSPKLNKFLFSSSVVENSSFIICVVANHELLNLKYANRAYRYLLLESGHVAQNAYILAANEDVGIVEQGAFNDRALSVYLNLNPTQFCSTTLIFGVKEKEISGTVKNKNLDILKKKFFELRNFLNKKDVLNKIEIFSYQNSKYSMYKYATMATSNKIPQTNHTFATCGVGDTIFESQLKCLVEMYERYSCSFPRFDEEIIYKNQDNFFSISMNAPQNDNYLKKEKLSTISTGKKIKCVKGVDMLSGMEVLVPVDEVFYPSKDTEYYKSNSSGVAAHFDQELAVENAFYELIERDAILVTWYSKRVPNILMTDFFSRSIKSRVTALENNKLEVFFLDLTIDSCPVILCVICGDGYPMTSVGCSANIILENAIEKSLDEAELMYNSWKEKALNTKISVSQDVHTINDHGNVFARVNLRNSEYKWILSGKKITAPNPMITTFKELVKKFEPKLVMINSENELGLFVVRVMSKMLIPLTFGFGSEHYGHPRLKELQLQWGSDYPSPPHFIP